MHAALQLECVRFLVEHRQVEINQHDLRWGWTPLMRCAHMAHHTNMPYLALFEHLLQQGADASLTGRAVTITGIVSRPLPAPLSRVWLHGRIRHVPCYVSALELPALPSRLSVPDAARCGCQPSQHCHLQLWWASPSRPPLGAPTRALHTLLQLCITLPVLPRSKCRIVRDDAAPAAGYQDVTHTELGLLSQKIAVTSCACRSFLMRQ